MANKRTSGVHLNQFYFHMFNFVSRGSSKFFIFKWLAHKNFKQKMIFCAVRKYGISLIYRLISVKVLEKMIRSKYRRATPEFPVFYILRCLKMHN